MILNVVVRVFKTSRNDIRKTFEDVVLYGSFDKGYKNKKREQSQFAK